MLTFATMDSILNDIDYTTAYQAYSRNFPNRGYGGDSDTVACITGGIAEAFYKDIPGWIVENALRVLPADVIRLIEEFSAKYRRI